MVEMGWGPQVEQNAQRARECARPLETQKKKTEIDINKIGNTKVYKKNNKKAQKRHNLVDESKYLIRNL